MSILYFESESQSKKHPAKKKKPMMGTDMISAYKKEHGWENVKHSRDPLTPKGKRFF